MLHDSQCFVPGKRRPRTWRLSLRRRLKKQNRGIIVGDASLGSDATKKARSVDLA